MGIFGFQLGSLPVRYLGVPLISTKLSSSDCRILLEKIVARIKNWIAKHLSYGGRLQLIKSVLFSLQIYWMGLFILPKKIINKVDQLLRSFLWSGPELKFKGAKVSWDSITCLKSEGGLGIKEMDVWNKACMARLIWNICQVSSSSLWVDWVKTHLIRGHSFWDIPIPRCCSWTWRKVLQLRGEVRPLIRHSIGVGLNTWLWFDSWLPFGPIIPHFEERVIYDSSLSRHSNHYKWPMDVTRIKLPGFIYFKASNTKHYGP